MPSTLTKKYKDYHYERKNTVTNNIATYIYKINETFIDIFIGIQLVCIVYYHHGHDLYVIKN